jgi:protease I
MSDATRLSGRKILIIATDGFEQSELEVPRDTLSDAGAEVHVASLEGRDITGWDEDDWGDDVSVDLAIGQASADDYDALVLPGGQMNPDVLRTDDEAMALIRAFADAGKPIAAICHAPWLLIEAGLTSGKRITSYHSIETDVRNSGAIFVDESVVVDGNIITSRNPDDLADFNNAIIEALAT